MTKTPSGKRADQKQLEEMFRKRGYENCKWIDPKRTVVGQWARMKCMFGCKNYGKCGTCPPNTPSVPECEAFSVGIRPVLFSISPKGYPNLKTVLPGQERLIRSYLSWNEKSFFLDIIRLFFCLWIPVTSVSPVLE
jgi:hypothetical protein